MNLKKSIKKIFRLPSVCSKLIQLYNCQKKNSSCIIMLGTPEHGNLGDQAIVKAEKEFLYDQGMEHKIVEIQRHQYEMAKKKIRKMIRNTDLIIVDGGGNVGTLWPAENDRMNDIISTFYNNPIVVFPQTAYFEDSSYGITCKKKIKRTYIKCQKLLFFSRDINTFNTMNQLVPGLKNRYVPDIVLYLKPKCIVDTRKGVLLCLRNDKEKILTDDDKKYINFLLTKKNLQVKSTSTVISKRFGINEKNRDRILQEKFLDFSSAEIVITDRLHGMFFSAITGTPCIAIDNLSHKVAQGYSWIKNIPNILLINNINELDSSMDEALKTGALKYKRLNLDEKYKEITEEILHEII